MILPTKHLSEDRALLSVGATVLRCLRTEATVTRLWDDVRAQRGRAGETPIRFDWFILALDLLYALGAIEFDDVRVRRVAR